MSPVPAAVPVDALLSTKNCLDDYSFFLLLLGVDHSTIMAADLDLSVGKSVALQAGHHGPRGQDNEKNLEPHPVVGEIAGRNLYLQSRSLESVEPQLPQHSGERDCGAANRHDERGQRYAGAATLHAGQAR